MSVILYKYLHLPGIMIDNKFRFDNDPGFQPAFPYGMGFIPHVGSIFNDDIVICQVIFRCYLISKSLELE